MNNKFLLLVLSFSFSVFAEEKLPQVLSSISYGRLIKSCYRWVRANEYERWISKKKPVLTAIYEGFNRHLGRGGNFNKGIYCWHHPSAAARGGELEFYGRYLMRIDLVDDVVIFDRNKNTYYAQERLIIPEEKKQGIDSQVFYANYISNGRPWFQEYIIKDVKAIKGFTFNDQDLRESLEKGVLEMTEARLPRSEAHFFISTYCPFLTDENDLTMKVFNTDEYRYFCADTRRLIRRNLNYLREKWQSEIEEVWFDIRK